MLGFSALSRLQETAGQQVCCQTSLLSQHIMKMTTLQRAAGQWLTSGRWGGEVVGSAEALGWVAHTVVVLQAEKKGKKWGSVGTASGVALLSKQQAACLRSMKGRTKPENAVPRSGLHSCHTGLRGLAEHNRWVVGARLKLLDLQSASYTKRTVVPGTRPPTVTWLNRGLV